MATDRYVVPDLAALIHRLPRFTFQLRPAAGAPSGATFNVTDTGYIESLVAVACVPSVWLILTMLLLLVYMFTRCCVSHKYKHSFTALKWSLGVGASLTCVMLLVGFYGNQTLHAGLADVEHSTGAIASTINNVKTQVLKSESVLVSSVPATLHRLGLLLSSDSGPADPKIVARLLGKLSQLSDNVTLLSDFNVNVTYLNTEILPKYVRLTETIRWPATMILLSLMVILCSLLLVAVLRHSRWLLVFFSVSSLIAVVVSYVLSSAHLFTVLGLADFCVAPDATVRAAVTSQLASDPLTASTVTTYYLNCSADSGAGVQLPWQQTLDAGADQVSRLLARLTEINDDAVKYYPSAKLEPLMVWLRNDFNSLVAVLKSLNQLLQCRHLHGLYVQTLQALCGPTLVGLTVLLLVLLTCGLLFTVLTWCDAHVWIHIQKRRDYLRVDNEDPYGTTCRRPPSLSALNGQASAVPSAPASTAAAPAAKAQRGPLVLPPGGHFAQHQQQRFVPSALRNRTPPFPTANHGSLRPFTSRVSSGAVAGYRSGTLPTAGAAAATAARYGSPLATGLAPSDPPPYSAALMSTQEDYSDYDNYD